MPSDQIQQGKQKNPNDIDEMPVEPDKLNRRMVDRRKLAAPRAPHQPEQKTDADDHVQSMHAGHGEIKRKEDLRLARHRPFEPKRAPRNEMLFEFDIIFEKLYPQKNQTENNRQEQKSNHGPIIARLRPVNRQRHGKAAANQDRGVDAAQP